MEKKDVLKGSITGHMMRLALPSIGGMFAITAFNLTDTYFVSRLGTDSLAAMGFTFPIILIIGTLSAGISLGAGSVLARAMGAGDKEKMHRIATDGILLSILAVLIISLVGYFTITPLFKAFGAEGEVLSQVRSYMSIWYLGAFVFVVPPVSDSSMRAMGDMIRPLMVMLLCAVVNVILDPILIFGFWKIPPMGISGAAIATIISRALGMALSLSFVHFHYKLLNFRYKNIQDLLSSWWAILHIGIPNVLVRLLPQITRALMTKLAAKTTVAAVAAIAVGQRIESFSIIISMAIGVSIVPIVGQNYGAQNYTRVLEMRRLLIQFATLYGIALTLLTFPLGEGVSKLFSQDPEVVSLSATYLKIIFVGSIGLNQYNWISEAFNACGKPHYSLLINTTGTLLCILPALLTGYLIEGFSGMIWGLTFGQIVVGLLAIVISKRSLTYEPKNSPSRR